MKSLTHFIQYNNAVPLVLSFLLLGAGATFASTEAGQGALIGRQETVVSVDNSFLLAKNLIDWSPKVTVTNVVKEGSQYIVTYSLETIDVDSYIWRDVVKTQEMRVDEEVLVKYIDLAAYVQFQLKDVVVGEKDRLVRTQEIQKDALTPKTTVISYTGLIGAVLTEDTVVADPYAVTPSTEGTVPVVIPAQEAIVAAAAEVPTTNSQESSTDTQQPTATNQEISTTNPQPSANTQEPITVTLLGTDTVVLTIGDSYTDLGALAKDADGNDLAITRTVNGSTVADTDSVSMDTSIAATHTIVYTAVKGSDTVSVTRTIVVNAPATAPALNTADVVQPQSETQTPSSEIQSAGVVAPETNQPSESSPPAITQPTRGGQVTQ